MFIYIIIQLYFVTYEQYIIQKYCNYGQICLIRKPSNNFYACNSLAVIQ